MMIIASPRWRPASSFIHHFHDALHRWLEDCAFRFPYLRR
jgi:hypothetical protein